MAVRITLLAHDQLQHPITGDGGDGVFAGADRYQGINQGLRVQANTLRISPCLPAHWESFQISYRHHSTLYRIQVEPTSQTPGGQAITLDGAPLPSPAIPLVDDGHAHAVHVQVHKTGA